MNLVYVYGHVIDTVFRTVFQPFTVVPFVVVHLVELRCGARTGFHMVAVRIAFHDCASVLTRYGIFVVCILFNLISYFGFPQTVTYLVHGVFVFVPIVKITDHADRYGVRCPYSEDNGVLIYSM